MGLFADANVLAFESRRAKEIAELIRINGGEPVVAPAMVEVPIENNPDAYAFAHQLYAGKFDVVIFLTGAGTRYLGQVLAARDTEEKFRDALRKVKIVARGPKPVAVLREWNVPITVQVPEPNTHRELLTAMQTLDGTRVAVQEYGRSNPELLRGLEAQGRQVTRIPVYQWRLPENTAPLEQALSRLLAGDIAVTLFTTGAQLDHVLEFASEHGTHDAVLSALRKTFVASIGPTCSEALRSAGIEPALEPSHPKMGLLVREAAQAFALMNERTTSKAF
jgi:uroporphyrinogen-III synthase